MGKAPIQTCSKIFSKKINWVGLLTRLRSFRKKNTVLGSTSCNPVNTLNLILSSTFLLHPWSSLQIVDICPQCLFWKVFETLLLFLLTKRLEIFGKLELLRWQLCLSCCRLSWTCLLCSIVQIHSRNSLWAFLHYFLIHFLTVLTRLITCLEYSNFCMSKFLQGQIHI